MQPLPEVTELEEVTANLWLKQGTIHITSWGAENTYYKDAFDNAFFCKNYPIHEFDTSDHGLIAGVRK